MTPDSYPHTSADRNFDDLSERFRRTIYDTPRGALRLAALRADFLSHAGSLQGKRVRDLGGGQGQFSLELAQQGASVQMCDISTEMLEAAKQAFALAGEPLETHCCSIQEAHHFFTEQQADVVLNHAVLEWLEQPLTVLTQITAHVAAGGLLSLMFYNLHGHRWRQLMNGNPENPEGANPRLRQKGNAPQHPLDPELVLKQLEALGFEILQWRGIRCIHDHMPQKVRERVGEADIETADLKYGLLDPYRQLGRYIHVMARKYS
jgi:S-adenosylmethionine-dependent methyltransferase